MAFLFRSMRQCLFTCFLCVGVLMLILFLQQGFSFRMTGGNSLQVVKTRPETTVGQARGTRLRAITHGPLSTPKPPVPKKPLTIIDTIRSEPPNKMHPAVVDKKLTTKLVISKVVTPKATTRKAMAPKSVVAHAQTEQKVEKNPIPEMAVLNTMSFGEIVNLYHSYVMSPQATCNQVKRMGVVKDGGWEMCDEPRFKPDPNNCLVYSFGINWDFSYDDDIAEYGCEVHSFDPSMKNTKDHLRGERVHFHATGIGAANGIVHTDPENPWMLNTLGFHRRQLNHHINQRRIDILKIDVEGDELASLTTALKDGSLLDIRQMSLETHLSLNGDPTVEKYKLYLNLLRQLYDIGFRIYHTARNHVWSSFNSKVIHKQRVTCHEINMVNIRLSMNSPSS